MTTPRHNKHLTKDQLAAAKRKGSEAWLAYLVRQGKTDQALTYATKAGLSLPGGAGVEPVAGAQNHDRITCSPKIVSKVDLSTQWPTCVTAAGDFAVVNGTVCVAGLASRGMVEVHNWMDVQKVLEWPDTIEAGIGAATTATLDSAKTTTTGGETITAHYNLVAGRNTPPMAVLDREGPEVPQPHHDPLEALKHNPWGEMDTWQVEVVRVVPNPRIRVIRFEQGPEAVLWVRARDWRMLGWRVWVKVNPDTGYGGYVMVGRYNRWGKRTA